MSFKRGDLLLIPFPFTDLSSIKRRPVLALTSPNARGDFVGLPVTSQPQGEPALSLTSETLDAGVLPRPSWIKVDHPVTLHAGLVVRSVARVQREVVDECIRRLCAGLAAQVSGADVVT